MTFYQTLHDNTKAEREYLLSSPIFSRVFEGQITLDDYIAFLQQAYHHVKHTVPLLMATGSRLTDQQEWLREAVAEYIEEEIGHQEWVLNDIAACGVDKESARRSKAAPSTELMVAYAYDAITRINPLAFFGMVFVLEGTSITIADSAARQIAQILGLPQQAFSYLTSHGALDQEHIVFFESLMNKITNADDQAVIIHSAKMFYRLYAAVFRELDNQHGLPVAA